MAKKRFTPVLPKEPTVNSEDKPVIVEMESIVVTSVTEETPVVEEIVVVGMPTEATVEALEPVVEEAATVVAPEPVIAPVAVSEYSEELSKLLDLCKQTGNQAMVNYINELLDYAKKMAPKQTMPTATGAMNQVNFFNTMISIIDHTGKDFRLAFATMLCIFKEYKNGAYGGAYVLRFMEEVALNKAKRNTFVKLVNLCSMTADPKTRKAAIKHIDFNRELVGSISAEGKMRIVAFYNT
jgi:hypothetical protein